MIFIVPCEHCGSLNGMPLKSMVCVDCGKERPQYLSVNEHWCPHCKSFDGHTGDCQTYITKLVDVAKAARDISNTNARMSGGGWDKLRAALAALEEDK